MTSFIPNPNHTSNHAYQANLTYIYHGNNLITNPCIHLSWNLINLAFIMSCQGSNINTATLKDYIRASRTSRIYYPTKHIYTHHQTMLSNNVHVHMNVWLTFTYLTVSMHEHVNACSWYLDKKERENLNPIC